MASLQLLYVKLQIAFCKCGGLARYSGEEEKVMKSKLPGILSKG